MNKRWMFFIAALAFAVLLIGHDNRAYAHPSYFTSQGCSNCHGSTATCNGCHQHGTHDSLNGAINITGKTDKTTYSPGDTVTVTINGGWQSGWIRAILYDQNMSELARSTGPTGMGGGAGYPITLTAPAPTTPGTYTWNVSWYGNYSYNPGPFQTACSSSRITNCWKPSSNPNHGEEIVATNSFTVAGSTPPPSSPAISVTDSVAPTNDLQVPFGSVIAGSSAQQTVTIKNTGTADLVIGAVASANPLAAPFAVAADTCSNRTISPAASCSLTVSFSPAAPGTFSDSFDIPSSDPANSSVTVNVNGTGTAAPTPAITVTDSVAPTDDLSVLFGTITIGSTGSQTVTVTNSGSADLVIGAVGDSNPLAAPFAISADTCSNRTIAPASSCTITVSFSPTTAEPFADSFDIPSNDASTGSVTVDVSGTGTSSPGIGHIRVTDPVAPDDDLQLPFGNVSSGRSVDRTITIANTGNGDLLIGNIGVANPLADPFAVTSDQCSGTTLAAGMNCAVTIRFSSPASCLEQPTHAIRDDGSTGGSLCQYSDSFDIPSNDPDDPSVTMQVSGAGVSSSYGNNPPDRPQLLYPADHQQNLGTSLTMMWQASSDPDGDPVSYELLISSDPEFGSTVPVNTAGAAGSNTAGRLFAGTGVGFLFLGFVFAGTSRGKKMLLVLAAAGILGGSAIVGCSNGTIDLPGKAGTLVTQQVSGLDSATTYYWKVIASDSNGGITESEVHTFSTK